MPRSESSVRYERASDDEFKEGNVSVPESPPLERIAPMSDSSATPTVDELRERGAWSPALDKFAEWDPDWTERCARMTNNPWTTGVLPVKWIELICTALNAVCTH